MRHLNQSFRHVRALARQLLFLIPLFALGSPVSSVDIIPVDQIRPGARGTGLTVLSGDSVVQFEVEVIDVMRNVTPRGDLILCRLSGAGLEHTGVIQGMSGSPIYIDGRIAGAVAYAWGFSKDPIAGITPIAEMTSIWQQEDNYSGRGRRSSALGRQLPRTTGCAPLPLPLAVSGLSPRAAEILTPALAEFGLTPVMAASGRTAMQRESLPRVEPGCAIGVALADGDVSMAAVGTLTFREGDRILAFGHPMMQAGPVRMPMIVGTIHGVLPSVASSFKFFSPGPVVGAVTEDRLTGIAGRLGMDAPMLPVRVRLESPTNSEVYSFRVVQHEELSPVLLAVGLTDIIFRSEGTMEETTIESEMVVRFHAAVDTLESRNPPLELRLRHLLTGPDPVADLFRLVRSELSMLLENRFVEIHSDEVLVTLRFRPGRAQAWLTSTTPDRQTVRPGDNLRIALRLTDYRGRDTICLTDIPIPATARPGRLEIFVGPADSLLAIESNRAPGRFEPTDLKGMVELLQRSGNEDRLRIVGLTSSSGFTVSGRELPSAPPSLRRVLATRPPDRRVEPTFSSVVFEQSLAVGSVVSGVGQFGLEVRE